MEKKKRYSFRNMKRWQKTKFLTVFFSYFAVAFVFLTFACSVLIDSNLERDREWADDIEQDPEIIAEAQERGANATKVLCGTYIENVKELSVKNSYWKADGIVWFKWEGDPSLDMANNFRIYKGTISKTSMVRDYHENGLNYQMVRFEVTILKNFAAATFPIDTHDMHLYIESSYPVEKVMMSADTENSGLNTHLSVMGYDVIKYRMSEYYMQYDSTRGDPTLDKPEMSAEVNTSFEIERNGLGLYLKCFIALFGTSLWMLIVLFVNSYHEVDALSLIPAALFGAVSNIMVGANLMPDVMDTGLVEFVNIWGIITILGVAQTVIQVNRVRKKYDSREFAQYLGKFMFYTIVPMTVLGHILMPLICIVRL